MFKAFEVDKVIETMMGIECIFFGLEFFGVYIVI